MGFARQGYWSGLPFPPPGDLPNPRIGTQRKQSSDSFSATVTSGASGGMMERLKGDAVARCRTRVKVPYSHD